MPCKWEEGITTVIRIPVLLLLADEHLISRYHNVESAEWQGFALFGTVKSNPRKGSRFKMSVSISYRWYFRTQLSHRLNCVSHVFSTYIASVKLPIIWMPSYDLHEYGTTINVDLTRRIVPWEVKMIGSLHCVGFNAIREIILNDFPRPILSASRPPFDSGGIVLCELLVIRFVYL